MDYNVKQVTIAKTSSFSFIAPWVKKKLQASKVLFSFTKQKITSFGPKMERRNTKQCLRDTKEENHEVCKAGWLRIPGECFFLSIAAKT